MVVGWGGLFDYSVSPGPSLLKFWADRNGKSTSYQLEKVWWWWGGLFDYSVSPGPSFWNSELIKRGKPQVISLKNFGCGGIGWPVSLYCLSRSLLLKFWQLMFNVEIVLLLELSSYFWSIVWTFSTIKLFTIRDILLFKYWIIICLQKSNKYKYK